MSTLPRLEDRFIALDPRRSVTVEACAGSGKTWQLTARLLRLLLADARPGEILAITYTRKAAREIESRLRSLLATLATAPERTAHALLVERGVPPDEAYTLLPQARTLFEQVLYAEPPITITTFHGWFARLLAGAPLDSGLAGRTLDESSANLLDEAWVLLALDCARDAEGEVAQALLWLYAELGAYTTRKLLRAFIDRRAEWLVWQAQQGGLPKVLAWLDEEFGVGRNPLTEMFAPPRLDELEEFARLLGQNTSTDQALGNALAQALVDLRCRANPADSDLLALQSEFDAIGAAFLTAEQAPRKRKDGAAQAKRLGAAGEARFLSLHEEWCQRLTDVLGALQDQANARLNRQALMVGTALLAKLDDLKAQRQVIDFTDLEVEVDKLLSREASAAYLQARLDARYKHILLDEFQDTNPLQWRILRGWLDAYPEAGIASPSVFLVGDPKQSIYRFRRAEPKLFTAAVDYLKENFAAFHVTNAHTYRNAGGVTSLVNAVFEAPSGIPGFVSQSSQRNEWPARIELIPLIPASFSTSEDAEEILLRNPLERPRVEPEDLRRAEEARLLAWRIGEIVGKWEVHSKEGGTNPARYSDILILTRRKTALGIYEAALRDVGIPFVSPGRGGLLDTLEAQDLLATLRFLASPGDNLALAHLLRTPAFCVSDTVLLDISANADATWWQTLQVLAQQREDADLRRAVGLLQGWLQAAVYLPAHDLLDRIIHEADWFARCRAVIPASLWPGVHANLEALFELALNVDGGRYPSLTRFVDELRRLSRADDEAPDEGLIAAGGGEGLGRVRIMTIHGAKGLEAPIVWLIDANSPTRGADGYDVAMDWPADQKVPKHFSLLGKISEAGPARAPILEREAQAAAREELNLLYVVVTRAEQVFIASGIEVSRGGRGMTPYVHLATAMQTLNLRDSLCLGNLPQSSPEDLTKAMTQPAVKCVDEGGDLKETPAVGHRRVGDEQNDLAVESQQGKLFGVAMHAWLEAATAGWPLPDVSPDVERAARSLLERSSLKPFFDASKYLRAGSETSFMCPDGTVGRIDRWVDLGDAIWILDYKSGHPDETMLEKYRLQLEVYRGALKTIFPQRVIKAMLLFTDGGEQILV